MCRTFEVSSPGPQLGFINAQSNGQMQPKHAQFMLPSNAFYMSGSAYSAKQTQAAAEEEPFKPQTLQLKTRPSGSKPSVVSAMNPAEFPFPAVPSTPFQSKTVDMPFIADAKHIAIPDLRAGKFLVIPYDESAPFGQQQGVQKQEEKQGEPTVREPAGFRHSDFSNHGPVLKSVRSYPAMCGDQQARYQTPVQAHPSIKHRASCHRCGNLRKKNVYCTKCPHTFCQRCAEKMQEEHGMDVFKDGCPVCKDLCCCGKNRSMQCTHKYHCYKKCPLTKRNRPSQSDQQFSPPAQMMMPNSGAPYYGNMMNMMTPPMHGLNTGFYPQPAVYDGPPAPVESPPMQYKAYAEPEWPQPSEPPKPSCTQVVLGKHANSSSAEDTTSASELEDLLEDESLQAFKRSRFDTSPSAPTSSDEEFLLQESDTEDLLALLSEGDSFFAAMQELDAAGNNKAAQPEPAPPADNYGLLDEQLLSLLQF